MTSPVLDPPSVDSVLEAMFAPWIRAMGLRTIAVTDDGASFLLPANSSLVHGGGVVCGQALASAFDTAAVLSLSALNGGFRPVTTIDFAVHFIRPVQPGDVMIAVDVVSNGKRVAFVRCEARAKNSDKLAATATVALMYVGV